MVVLLEDCFLFADFHGCVDVHKEAWEAGREVLNKLIWHSTQRSFHLFWKLSVMVFLANTKRKKLTLDRTRTEGSWVEAWVGGTGRFGGGIAMGERGNCVWGIWQQVRTPLNSIYMHI